ncbi:MOSC domain-containing protein [Streptomyces sp. A7024]|uniref:MOSC domain-containing protein n=1 Tax=Streptomyces coryli TaxID=1128680 RepID=A0A6G4U5G8_9ACTN|nr:MOSC domain-containing protein [Streptomyces coryli]NGN67252.1 MOSC domain-containing protein [Streptomyces coryli]
MQLLSVNIGSPKHVDYTSAPASITGIDKRPVTGPVAIASPGQERKGGSGVAGDTIGDQRVHGGNDQAVYAYAREDLDTWSRELGRELRDGAFGENLTTSGHDLGTARIGERWRVGGDRGPLLEITGGRIPCRTFAGFLDEQGWVKRFTEAAVPGVYLRVLEPGDVAAGDAVEVVRRPDHDVTVELWFRASTTQRELLPRLLPATDVLHHETTDILRKAGLLD